MWPVQWHETIRTIHGLGNPTVIVVTGGGATAISELLAIPGASRTIMETRVPYSQVALWEWLGKKPDQACDEHTALAMASVACQRSQKLVEAEKSAGIRPALDLHGRDSGLTNYVGLSCTASLASDRPKRGDHRLFAAIQTPWSTYSYSLILKKGARTRHEEEELTSQILVRMLAESADVNSLPSLSLLPNEMPVLEQVRADSRLAAVRNQHAALIWSLPDGKLSTKTPLEICGVVCGAFDPLHHGHQELRRIAEVRLGGRVGYELSITNVDKPPLDYLSIERRRKQFVSEPLVLTNAPRFLAKAAALPNMTFVIGSDTAERLLNAKYDGGTQESLNAVLQQIQDRGCRFLVACRVVSGVPLKLSDLHVPAAFQDLFEEIPESEFRVDVSSTELRQRSSDLK